MHNDFMILNQKNPHIRVTHTEKLHFELYNEAVSIDCFVHGCDTEVIGLW